MEFRLLLSAENLKNSMKSKRDVRERNRRCLALSALLFIPECTFATSLALEKLLSFPFYPNSPLLVVEVVTGREWRYVSELFDDGIWRLLRECCANVSRTPSRAAGKRYDALLNKVVAVLDLDSVFLIRS